MSDNEQWWGTASRGDRFASIQWDDASIGFTCACGAAGLMVDGEGEPVTCPNCGRQFRLITDFQSREAEHAICPTP